MLSIHRSRSGSRSAWGGASVAGRSVTKSGRGGGEPPLWLPPPPPRTWRGTICLSWASRFLPSSGPRAPPPCPPSGALSGPVPLAVPSSSPYGASSPPRPPAFPLPLGTRPWGREREALCPPGCPAQPRGPPGAGGPAPSPLRAIGRVGGRTRVPECARELLAYKQEAPNHWHTVVFLIVYWGGADPASWLWLGDLAGTSIPRSPCGLPAPAWPAERGDSLGEPEAGIELDRHWRFHPCPPVSPLECLHTPTLLDCMEMNFLREVPKFSSCYTVHDLWGWMGTVVALTSPVERLWNKS